MRLALIVLLLLPFLPSGQPRLRVTPAAPLDGEMIHVRVSGARPGQVLTLTARSAGGPTGRFEAQASFRADRWGRLDLERQAPIAGDYPGVDPRGLFWSQRPVTADWAKPAPDTVALDLSSAGVALGQAGVTLRPAEPDIARLEVRQAGLVGALYARKGTRHRPVVVLLHGSEGGFDFADWLGPRLASEGYAVFGLVYFAPGPRPVAGAPTALNGIPLEQLVRVRTWLAGRPQADVERFAVVGGSKGGELALVLAATYPWIDAVVAFTPSDLVTQGFQYGSGEVGMGSSWSLGGRDLAFLPQTGLKDEIAKYRVPGGQVRLADVRRANLAAASPELLAAARIRVEDSRAALLLLGGADDQTADSGTAVSAIAARLGSRPRFEWVVYPGAGHLIVGTGWRPTTTHNLGASQDGGSPAADARAQADGWLRMLRFLRRYL
jgi:dienelactone hydrolase